MIEYIAGMRIDTDGDWRIEGNARSMYYEDMIYDGGYNQRVKICEDPAEAWMHLENLALAVFHDLTSSDEDIAKTQEYPRSFANLAAILQDARNRADFANMANEMAKIEFTDGYYPECGGIAFSYETGNWSWEAAFLVRMNGIVGELEEMQIDGDKPFPTDSETEPCCN